MGWSRVYAVVLAAVLLSGCHVSVDSGGQKIVGAGVTFVVPYRTSQISSGPSQIDYRSEGLNASTDGDTLLVDGRSYGGLSPGDVVDLTEQGVVKVNGVARAADDR